MADDRPNDHRAPNMTPHDPAVTEPCPACSWHVDMCHCPTEGTIS